MFLICFTFVSQSNHKMDNEVKEILELSKPTVGVRLELPKGLHKKAMKKHGQNHRSWTFADSLIDLIKKGLESPNQ